jgi:hypothetical protein
MANQESLKLVRAAKPAKDLPAKKDIKGGKKAVGKSA